MGTRAIAHVAEALIARTEPQAQYDRQPIYDCQTSMHKKFVH